MISGPPGNILSWEFIDLAHSENNSGATSFMEKQRDDEVCVEFGKHSGIEG